MRRGRPRGGRDGRASGRRRLLGGDDRAGALAGAGAGEFLVADSEALPFSDASFTAVLCTASFHHYPQPERALAEMARVLAPHLFDGGYAIIRARPR